MALLKQTDTRFGIAVEYWKITKFTLDVESNTSSITLSGYVDEQSRLLGKSPVVQNSYSWTAEDNPVTINEMDVENNNPIKLSYLKLKESSIDAETGLENSFFADSQDAI